MSTPIWKYGQGSGFLEAGRFSVPIRVSESASSICQHTFVASTSFVGGDCVRKETVQMSTIGVFALSVQSFVTQRLNRVDGSRSETWNQTGHNRSRQQQHRDQRKRNWIKGGHSI